MFGQKLPFFDCLELLNQLVDFIVSDQDFLGADLDPHPGTGIMDDPDPDGSR